MLGVEPDYSTAFIFTNKDRDCLLDDSDGQIVMKRLDKGAFLLPAASDDGTP